MKASMSTCRLEQIQKYHSSLSELVNNYQLPPFPVRFSKLLTQESIHALLELSPIHAMPQKNGDGFTCVGGIRLLMLARTMLPPEYEIPILLYHASKISKVLVQKRFLVELYHQPELMTLAHGDTKMAGLMYPDLEELDEDLLKGLQLDTADLQAYWAGVSSRTVKRGKE